MRISGKWNFGILETFISGLVGAIFINHLITGFIEIISNIDRLLTWLEKPGTVHHLVKLFFG